MKAKKVYEFKRTRKQGLSTQTEINLTNYNRIEIERWFKKWAPGVNYKIEDDLSVYVFDELYLEGYNEDTFPFNNLIVESNLILEDSTIKKLPDKLHVYHSILSNNTIFDKLPNDLKIGFGLALDNNPNITELPENFQFEHYLVLQLDISYTNISKLPISLFNNRTGSKYIFGGNMILNNSKITDFMSGHSVRIDGTLDISDTPITKLPRILTIKGDFIHKNISQDILDQCIYQVIGDEIK